MTLLLFPLITLVFLPLVGTLWSVAIGALTALAGSATILSASPEIKIYEHDGVAWLQVARARVQVEYLGVSKAIPTTEFRSERGPRLSAKAFVYFQAGVSGMLKVEITDEKDPAPYWLFSTRHASQLEKVLASLRG